jgi:O-antigen ligase
MKITELAKIQIPASDIGGYCVALFLVSIYFSTALAIALSVVLALLWGASGQFRYLSQLLKNYPVALWSLLLFACFLVGSYHGDAPRSDAVAMLKKYRELLFIPLLLPFLTEARYRQWAWLAFIVASVVTLVGSQLMNMGLFCVNLQCLPYFKSYITHGIFIAFFAFFITHKAFDSRGLVQILYSAILLLCLYNLFFVSQGRTGQLIFIVLMPLFAIQRFSKKGLLLSVLVMTILLASFIGFSDKAVRIKEGFASAKAHLHANAAQGEYSMGERFTFWKYSAKLIAKKPIFGHGTGNFTKAYQDMSGRAANNPHNEFLLIGVQLGAIGLVFYLGFFASQYYYARTLPEHDKWMAQGLLAALIVTSLFNSPLMDHTEGHWFTMMIALCFAARTTILPTVKKKRYA